MAVSVIAFSEKLVDGRWVLLERDVMSFHGATYSAFLAGIRNWSVVPPIAEPRGVPADVSEAVGREFRADASDAVAPSWLSIGELQAFDYERAFEDRRVERRTPQGWIDGAATCEPGEGKITTYRNFLGSGFFEELDRLVRSGSQRVVFWFSI